MRSRTPAAPAIRFKCDESQGDHLRELVLTKMSATGPVIDEDNVERQRQARWFADAKAGLNHELERTLGSRPPQDWKGHAYEWIHLKGQDERTAFSAAAVAGQLHTVKLLAERGANVLDVDLANETALHAAACNGHIEVMTWLVEHGVPIDAQSKTGATPLLCAVHRGHQNAVLQLLRAKAAVDLADDHMTTPLILAARENRVEIAQHLLRYGASMHAADSTQETPLTYAQGSMRTLLWTTSATRGDVAGLRRLLAHQVGGRGDDPCMQALTTALSLHRLAGGVTMLGRSWVGRSTSLRDRTCTSSACTAYCAIARTGAVRRGSLWQCRRASSGWLSFCFLR